MTVAYTSILSFASLGDLHLLTVRDKVLFTISKAMNPSNADLERLSGIRLSSVCARVNELREAELIELGGLKKDPFTEKKVQWWKLTAKGEEVIARKLEKEGSASPID